METQTRTTQSYINQVNALPKGDKPYDDETSQWRSAHVLLNKTLLTPPCGCEVDGYGTIPAPVVIRFCPLHGAAERLAALVEDAARGYMNEDSYARWQADARAALASVKGGA